VAPEPAEQLLRTVRGERESEHDAKEENPVRNRT
jgi:hypothetical protein